MTSSGTTSRLGPPTLPASASNTATETRHVATIARGPQRSAASATAMLTGKPTNEASPEITAGAGTDSTFPGRVSAHARYATNQARTAETSQILPANPRT